ncbi:DUF4178 domain-containing protein [Microbispora sp. NPDC049125]|uniref:DUF4178 domain-containing protein n=1 Tax=Microbispora sp. NPDC049125 TaxID=3154929 RepID=UPI003466C0A5
MTTVIVLLVSLATIVVVLGALVVTARQEREPAPPPRRPPGEPEPAVTAVDDDAGYFDPRSIMLGDTVYVEAARYRAIGILHLSMQGDQWTEYLLDEGARRYNWLSVKERAPLAEGEARHLEVLLWTDVPTQGMVPAKHMLIVDGVEFHPLERGTAAFRSEGMTGLPDRGLLDYADYRAQDGRVLSFQRVQGGQWKASYARALTPGSIRVERLP